MKKTSLWLLLAAIIFTNNLIWYEKYQHVQFENQFNQITYELMRKEMSLCREWGINPGYDIRHK